MKLPAAGVGFEPTAFRRRIVDMARRLPGEESQAVAGVSGPLGEFLAFLQTENATTNFVSAKAAEPEELVNRHLEDSLLGLPFLPRQVNGTSLRLLDIGSGGGFPAIPLLLVRRDFGATLVEATRKKCAFLEAACRRLALTAEVVNARFPGSFPMNRPPYDILTTRAVAAAGRLVRAARPLLSSSARALLWTSEPLFQEAARESGAKNSRFILAAGAERRGLAILESFT